MRFREHHIISALKEFSAQQLPLDLFLNRYFRAHQAVGSKDRRFVGDTIYSLVRWQGLLDHFTPSTSWENRLCIWNEINPLDYLFDHSIPQHKRVSCPPQLFDILEAHYGNEKATELMLISNQTAPTTIRVNPLKISRDALIERWKDLYAFSPTEHSSLGIVFKEKTHLLSLPEFKEGLFEIQDEGSQLVADLVRAQGGDQVLDYCAGSGGKTLAFAHKLMKKGQIYLHDIRKSALAKAKNRLRRAGIENAQFHCPTHLKGKMDWVLVDVPCSGLGTLRRNPDVKWKWSFDLVMRLVKEQREIFAEAVQYVKKGGHIVYATCSILPQENEEQQCYFLKNFPLIQTEIFKVLPVENGMDGFFAATFQLNCK